MNASKAKNEQVYKALKADILNGEYLPDHHLDKEVLMEKYGFSTTPTNFALVRLSNEGLVEKRGRDGFYTRKPIATTELKEAYMSTGAILKMAAREFFQNNPHIPFKLNRRADLDVVAGTEQLFEFVGSLSGAFMFSAILKTTNDRLHFIRKSKQSLIGDGETELASLFDALESRDPDNWEARVDSYISRRLELVSELAQLTQPAYRKS